ncbi:MAG TPA: hypothetical protein VNK04_14895, partial [Gemmataceae bacterium]|nr:hypothetical protein [Gemmataceae bacterium]
LILRAAPGCRPLLVWDTARPPLIPTPRGEKGESLPSSPSREEERVRGADDGPATPTFLSVSRGSLTLQGLDLAVSWDDSTAAQRALLVRVADGDFLARDCTFSQTGYLPGGTVLVRFEGQEGPGKKCRLSRCYARGAGLVALDLDAPGAEVLLDGCLIAGGEPALLQVSGTEALPGLGDGRAAPTLRVLRSTLVCDRTLLQIRPVSPADRNPALNWMAWDALLARWGEQVGGAMVAPVGEVGTEGLRWQAINCLYAGWRTLLAGRGAIPASNWEAWQRRWQRSEGDAAVSQRWPAARPAEPAEVGPEFYRPEDTPAVAFAAMSGPGLLGCDLSALPPVRDNWLSLTFRGFAAPPVDLLADGSAPEIPAPGDDLYHGERLDLSRIDLGAYLQQLQKSGKKLGPRVVLHLTGSGERPTSPIRLKGTTLVLYFEPPEKKPGEPGTPPPLVLTPPRNLSTTLDVLIDVEDGDLEVIGGEIRFPDSRLALVPRHLLRVRRGNLLLYGCRLQGPVAQPPESYGGLIRLEGPCEPDASAITGCAINRSILLSGKAGIEVVGTGVAVRLQQCILATRQEAFRLDLGGAKTPPRPWARLKVRCLLENTTVAAPRAVIHLADAPQFPGPAEPAIFQTRSCAFLNPFTGSQPAVLLFEGDALTRGLLVWQGEGNAYDGRLSCYVLAKDAPVPEPQPYSVWTRLWGAVGDRQAIPALPLKSRMEATTLAPLDSLALTGLPSLDRPPGANLTLLGIVKSSRPPR